MNSAELMKLSTPPIANSREANASYMVPKRASVQSETPPVVPFPEPP